ncbi:MAG: hypothetical protein WAO77_15060 [Sphingobium sp.]
MRAVPTLRTGFDADDLPASRCWRRSEFAILDAEYPVGGSAAVHARLPHRSRRTIKQIAWKRGLRFARPAT